MKFGFLLQHNQVYLSIQKSWFIKTRSDFIHLLNSILHWVNSTSRTGICSLRKASSMANVRISVSVSKQGRNNRFDQKYVVFEKSIFKDCIKNEFQKVIAPDLFTAVNWVLKRKMLSLAAILFLTLAATIFAVSISETSMLDYFLLFTS